MKVLVTFALEAEFAPWRKRWSFAACDFRVSQHAPARCFSALVRDAEVTVFLTGMALRGAEPGLSFLLGQSPDVCICAGLAGGLRSSLKVGEIIAAQSVLAASGDSPRNCAEELVQLAARDGATLVPRLLTSGKVLSTARMKAEAAPVADAVDMETFPLLAKTGEKRIPTVVVRAVSDTSAQDLPLDFDRVANSQGAVSFAALAGQLLRRPARLPALVRFGRQSKRAAEHLAEFLDSFVPAVAARPLDNASESLYEVAAT